MVADRQFGSLKITWSSALTKYGWCCSRFGIWKLFGMFQKFVLFRFFFFFSPEPCHAFVVCSWETYQTLTCLLFIFLRYIPTTQKRERNKRDYCWNNGEVKVRKLSDSCLNVSAFRLPVLLFPHLDGLNLDAQCLSHQTHSPVRHKPHHHRQDPLIKFAIFGSQNCVFLKVTNERCRDEIIRPPSKPFYSRATMFTS